MLLDGNSSNDATKMMGPERVKALAEIGFTKDVELLESHGLYEHTPCDDEENTSTAY